MQKAFDFSIANAIPLCLQKIEAANGYGDGDDITQTKLMYKAFLGYAQLKEYVRVLTENNLLNLTMTHILRRSRLLKRG